MVVGGGVDLTRVAVRFVPGTEDLHWVWLIVPNGLEDFFRLIGRSRVAGEAAPANFPRPDNVLEIERQTVFAVPPTDQRNP